MNFEVGGKRFYAMVGPEGQEHWSLQQYTSISQKPISKCTMLLPMQTKILILPGSNWDLSFSQREQHNKSLYYYF
jgi:hypothetical protein